MNYLTRCRPFHTPTRTSLFSDLFEDFFTPARWPSTDAWSPRVDVKETPEGYVLVAELPGLKPEQVEITFDGDVLSLKGERSSEEKREEETFHVVERSSGSFARSFRFPKPVDIESVLAEAKDGIITITVPKAAEIKPKQIEIKID